MLMIGDGVFIYLGRSQKNRMFCRVFKDPCLFFRTFPMDFGWAANIGRDDFHGVKIENQLVELEISSRLTPIVSLHCKIQEDYRSRVVSRFIPS